MYRNLPQSYTIKYRLELEEFIYIELTPEALSYINLRTTGIRDRLGIATLSDFGHSTEAPSLEA